jgi:hypothetical protein
VTDFLDSTDMARSRTPQEFVEWFDRKAVQLSSTPEAKDFVRKGSPAVKKFYDELFPLRRFVDREYGSRRDVLIQPNLSNDNYDARIVICGPADRQDLFVELTYAKEGRDLSLRMEVLEREGHVFLSGPVKAIGRKGSPERYVLVEPCAVRHEDALVAYFSLIADRLRGKSNMQYGKRHVLVVAVDDYNALIQDSDWPLLESFVRSLFPGLVLDFQRLVLVGIAGRLFLSFNLQGMDCA